MDLKELSQSVSAILGRACEVKHIEQVSGGSINDALRVRTSDGYFFLKMNDSHRYKGMFEKEVLGLEILKNSGAVRVPEVIGVGSFGRNSLLMMKYVHQARRSGNFFEEMGMQLALLHKTSASSFGLDHSNFIGSLIQDNKMYDTWPEFFVNRRLKPLVNLAAGHGYFSEEDLGRFKILYERLEELVPVENPSLLHGDLWSGNFISDENGNPVLIDPAVYFGNREVDIAMTKLFGGFDERFYDAYQEVNPMIAGWEERVPLHNLYPLLVHLNLFGRAYLTDILQTLRRFTG